MSIIRPEGGWNITRLPVHPGEMLREEFMKPLGISINGLALELHVPVTRISQIVNERRGITADTALRLARHFGNSPDFWMNLQKDYELLLTRRKSMKLIEKQVRRRIKRSSRVSRLSRCAPLPWTSWPMLCPVRWLKLAP